MAEMHPRQPNGAGPSQACASCPARDGAFDPGAARIVRLKRGRCFPLPGCLEGLIWRLGPDGERPPGIALLGAHTRRSRGAGPTVLACELHLDDRIIAVIHRGRPADTGLAGRTDGVWLGPSNREGLGIKAGSLAGLPVIIEARGPEQIDALVRLTLDGPLGVPEAGVHDGGARSRAPL